MSNWAKLKEKLQKPAPIKHKKPEDDDTKKMKFLGSASTKSIPPLGAGRNSFSKKRKRHDISDAVERERKIKLEKEEKESRLKDVESIRTEISEKALYVGIDCEMVGVGDGGTRSALARVTMVDFDGRVIYDEHVRPVERVTDFRTWVSGVKPKHLKEAITLKECIKQVGKLVKGKILVGHALHNDLQVLMLQHPIAMIRDTARYRAYMKSHGKDGGKLRPRRLKDLAKEVLGLEIQEGKHDSGEDARAAMLLYRAKREEWEKELRKKKHVYRPSTKK